MRALEFVLAFLLGVMFAGLLLYAATEPLEAPVKRIIRVEV